MITQLRTPNIGNVRGLGASVQITPGMSWADKFASGRRTIELWSCQSDHEGDCTHEQCQLRGFGIVLGVWAGTINKLPVNLFRLNGVDVPSLTHAFDEALKAGVTDLTPTTLITAVIYEITS